MKKISLPLLVVLATAVFSCKKKETAPTTSETSTKDFYLKKDGVVYDPTSLMLQHTSGNIFISTSTQPNETLGLRIVDTLAPGNYNFSPNGPFRMFYTPDGYTTTYVSESGIATITSHDLTTNKIQATFSCMLVCSTPIIDTIYITDGEINQTYPE